MSTVTNLLANMFFKIGGSKTEIRAQLPTSKHTVGVIEDIAAILARNFKTNVVGSWGGGPHLEGRQIAADDGTQKTGEKGDFATNNVDIFMRKLVDGAGELIREEGLYEKLKSSDTYRRAYKLFRNIYDTAKSWGVEKPQERISLDVAKDDVIAARSSAKMINLEPSKDLVLIICGTGYAVGIAKDYIGNGRFGSHETIEDSVTVDPNVDKYRALEGPIRNGAKLRAYLPGKRSDQADMGFKATVNYFLGNLNNYLSTQDTELLPELNAALEILNQVSEEKLSLGAMAKSSLVDLFNSNSILTNEQIIKAAGDGDDLASAMCLHQVRRIAERLQTLLQSRDIKPAYYAFQGGLGKGLFSLDICKKKFLEIMNQNLDKNSQAKLFINSMDMDGLTLLR